MKRIDSALMVLSGIIGVSVVSVLTHSTSQMVVLSIFSGAAWGAGIGSFYFRKD